jgi:hypothetical protein
MLAQRGRKNGKGAYTHDIVNSLKAMGKTVKMVDPRSFIDCYPKAHRVLKSVTSHHMDRFNKVWSNGKTYLCFTTNHVFAVVDGVNHDWTRGRAMQVVLIYEII